MKTGTKPGKNLRAILNGLRAAVLILDDGQVVTFANFAAKRHFGKKLRGRKIAELIADEDCLRAVASAYRNPKHQSTQVMLETRNPTLFKVTAVQLSPGKKVSEGETPPPKSVALSLEDISHIREAEQMRSDFVANVSHELRSPLTAMTGFIETLRDAARNDPVAQQRFLDLMDGEAKRMNRLIADLLNLAKMQAGDEAPSERVSLENILREVPEILSGQAANNGNAIVVEVPDDLPPVLGYTDDLKQLFLNLLENAIKYGGPKREITIAAKRSKKWVRISVNDQGEGIAAEEIPRLTERFYRIDKGRSRALGGTGLGLAIVKHILLRHGGVLEIDSTIGEGSSFTAVLPIDRRKNT